MASKWKSAKQADFSVAVKVIIGNPNPDPLNYSSAISFKCGLVFALVSFSTRQISAPKCIFSFVRILYLLILFY